MAHTILEQHFANPHAEPLEALYTLPLPADGAVIGYAIHIGEKVIRGEIETREQARAEYRRALEQGRTAGLLEQERTDTFTQSLGSLPPATDVRVEIEVLHSVAFHAGPGDPTWEYRFPTVVGVRYQGEPGRVADTERLDVERADGTPVRLELELVVADGAPAATGATSPHQRLTIDAGPQAGSTHLGFAEAQRLDRDVVIRWSAATDEVKSSVRLGGGLPGDDGRYGLVTITPPRVPRATLTRDLTLLLDGSGSMTGVPFDRAREIGERLLRDLGADDRFEILLFANQVARFAQEPAAATADNLRRGIDWLRSRTAGGGTEMASAIVEALRPLRADSQRQVVLLTDGYIGFESEVVGKILRGLPAAARLHAVGIGSAPGRTLTRGAARAGRGIELLVGEDAAIEEAVSRLHAATRGPVLTALELTGPAIRGVAPSRPRDVLAGQPLVAAVELTGEGGAIEVRGQLAGEGRPWTARLAVPPSTAPGADATTIPIGALYGREAIEDLEMELAAAAAPADLLDRIEALGWRHRIPSRRTSLVAIADEPSVDPRAPRRRERLPVELPAEVSAEGVGLVSCRSAMPCGIDASVRATVAPDAMMDLEWASQVLGAGAAKLRPHQRRSISEKDLLRAAMRRASVVPARCVRKEEDLVVIEFESPHDDLVLPAGDARVLVLTGSGSMTGSSIDAELSTRPGACAAGVTVRLALRRDRGRRWPRGPLRISWVLAAAAAGRPRIAEPALAVTLP